MLKEIRGILGKIRNFVVQAFKIFPVKNIIVFESNPDFNDEAFWICKKFLEEGMDKKYKIYWYLKERSSNKKAEDWNVSFIYFKPQNIYEWFEKYYVLYTARCILDSCMFIPKVRNEQFRFFLHHGMPIKKTETYMRNIGEYDYVSIGSSYFKKYYSSVGIDEKKMISFGMARNDQLGESKEYLKKLYKLGKDTKIIMWLPTYRQHNSSKEACNVPVETINKTGMPVLKQSDDFKKLNEVLKKENIFVFLKLHPSQETKFLEVADYSNIKVITNHILEQNAIQLYSLFSEADALITDYSSIYYDYLLLNRPIGLTIDDINIYKEKVGFITNDFFEKEIEGYLIRNTDEFISYIYNVKYEANFLKDVLKVCRDKFHNITDYSSTDKLYEFIVEKAGL